MQRAIVDYQNTQRIKMRGTKKESSQMKNEEMLNKIKLGIMVCAVVAIVLVIAGFVLANDKKLVTLEAFQTTQKEEEAFTEGFYKETFEFVGNEPSNVQLELKGYIDLRFDEYPSVIILKGVTMNDVEVRKSADWLKSIKETDHGKVELELNEETLLEKDAFEFFVKGRSILIYSE